MKLGRVVDWESEVLPCWRRAAHSHHPNADIWSRLPQGVCWVCADMEESDLGQLFVVGSQDWCDAFGSYQLQKIAQRYLHDQHLRADHLSGQIDLASPAPARRASSGGTSVHHTRVQYLCASLQQDSSHLLPLILVAADVAGPKVLLDGNHRALALWQLGQLAGQQCYLGLHWKMAKEFLWMRRALTAPGV